MVNTPRADGGLFVNYRTTARDEQARSRLRGLPRAGRPQVGGPVGYGDTGTDNTGVVDQRLRDLGYDDTAPGGGGDGGAAAANARALAAENAAKKAGKDQTSKENEATDRIVQGLLKGMEGYGKGRDQLLANADSNFKVTLDGIMQQYKNMIGDAEEFAGRNERDFDGKMNANITNMVRESQDLMAQVLSQGAGETDTLKALQQAARAYDSNSQDVATNFNDTLRSINSNINSANTSTGKARLDANRQLEEARAGAWNEFYKNNLDAWTNVQRTEAGNTNIDSDYSVGYKGQYSDQAMNKIGELTGKAYALQKPPPGWDATWDDKKGDVQGNPRLGNRAAAVSVGPMKRAEGASLRKW